jgi:predicted small secreted protein
LEEIMRMRNVRVWGSWGFLALAFGWLIVLPGCRTVQGVGQDVEAVGRGTEEVIQQETWE